MEVQALLFVAGDRALGLPVPDVQGVVTLQRLTRLPDAHPAVRGVTSLRGKITIVVDLRVRLGQAPAQLKKDQPLVLVPSARGVAALLVDEVVDIVLAEVTPAPPGEIVAGRMTLHDLAIDVLDPQVVLRLEQEARA